MSVVAVVAVAAGRTIVAADRSGTDCHTGTDQSGIGFRTDHPLGSVAVGSCTAGYRIGHDWRRQQQQGRRRHLGMSGDYTARLGIVVGTPDNVVVAVVADYRTVVVVVVVAAVLGSAAD